MTSKELALKTKKAKQIEKQIKTLERIRKDMIELCRMDFGFYRTITPEMFDDELYYHIKEKIEKLQTQLNYLV